MTVAVLPPMDLARTMHSPERRDPYPDHPRGTIRLLDDLAALERLLRRDERPARVELEAVLGRSLAAHVLHLLIELEPARSRRPA